MLINFLSLSILALGIALVCLGCLNYLSKNLGFKLLINFLYVVGYAAKIRLGLVALI